MPNQDNIHAKTGSKNHQIRLKLHAKSGSNYTPNQVQTTRQIWLKVHTRSGSNCTPDQAQTAHQIRLKPQSICWGDQLSRYATWGSTTLRGRSHLKDRNQKMLTATDWRRTLELPTETILAAPWLSVKTLTLLHFSRSAQDNKNIINGFQSHET